MLVERVAARKHEVGRGRLDRKSRTHLQQLVLDWFHLRGRKFPWRETNNAFHILVAEVLLRQTQSYRVAGPYLQLVRKFPTPDSLASADVVELRQWFRPLGLVKRADRLVQMAKILVERYESRVSNDLDAIEALPGMGTYSARAVLCLAFGARVPMVDEGSGRVLRRVLGRGADGPAYSDWNLLETATGLLPSKSCREFNLGLIDIAAAYCHAKSPTCSLCPLAEYCTFRSQNGVGATKIPDTIK